MRSTFTLIVLSEFREVTFHNQPFNKRSDFNDFTLIILGFVPVNVCSSHLQKKLFYFSYLFTVVFK